MNKLKIFLLVVNLLALGLLAYFALTDIFAWKKEAAGWSYTYQFYTIRSDVKALTGFCIILPVVLFFFKKRFWIIQSLVILVIAKNYNNDFLQKTIFINQPSSIQKTNNEVEKIINGGEPTLNLIIQKVNSQNIDSADINSLNKYTEKEPFKIDYISLKNKKVEYIGIYPKIKTQYHSCGIKYFPNNYNSKSFEHDIFPFGKNLSLTGSRTYFYKRKWLINIWGLAEG
jgi:hypothetical protein